MRMESLRYGDAYTPLLETTVQKNTAYPYNYRLLGINMDFDEQYEQDVKNALHQMQKTPGTTPDCIKELLHDASVMNGEDFEIHTYVLDTLEDLLKSKCMG